MKVAIFTSVFALFSGLVSSAAIPTAETDTSIVKARTVATYFPDLMIPIFEDDPDYAIKSSTWGEVSRYNGAHNVQTLVSFSVGDIDAGKTCTFSFSNPTWVSGSGKAQLFTVGGPITGDNTFNSRPFRNNFLGTFNAVIGEVATWDGPIPTFPCPTSPTTLGYEIVPQNDNDDIFWYIGSGLVIEVL